MLKQVVLTGAEVVAFGCGVNKVLHIRNDRAAAALYLIIVAAVVASETIILF